MGGPATATVRAGEGIVPVTSSTSNRTDRHKVRSLGVNPELTVVREDAPGTIECTYFTRSLEGTATISQRDILTTNVT